MDELRKICSLMEALPKSYHFEDSLFVAISLSGCEEECTHDGSKVRSRQIKLHPDDDEQSVKEVCSHSAFFPSMSANETAGLQSACCNMETPGSRQHCSFSGCDH